MINQQSKIQFYIRVIRGSFGQRAAVLAGLAGPSDEVHADQLNEAPDRFSSPCTLALVVKRMCSLALAGDQLRAVQAPCS